jgi:hypothetical protein
LITAVSFLPRFKYKIQEAPPMLFWLVVFFLIISLVMFVQKVVLKNAMQKKLGRKVEDHELTSISAWMDDKPSADQSKTAK